MPMRNSIGLSSGTSALRWLMPCYASTARGTASTTLLNSASGPGILGDPSAVLSDLAVDKRAQVTQEPSVRALFTLAGQAAVASHIGGKGGG
jgi:hypothetical protein